MAPHALKGQTLVRPEGLQAFPRIALGAMEVDKLGEHIVQWPGLETHPTKTASRPANPVLIPACIRWIGYASVDLVRWHKVIPSPRDTNGSKVAYQADSARAKVARRSVAI